jgi:hypothetical protein
MKYLSADRISHKTEKIKSAESSSLIFYVIPIYRFFGQKEHLRKISKVRIKKNLLSFIKKILSFITQINQRKMLLIVFLFFFFFLIKISSTYFLNQKHPFQNAEFYFTPM